MVPNKREVKDFSKRTNKRAARFSRVATISIFPNDILRNLYNYSLKLEKDYDDKPTPKMAGH